ncbi:hypothetical protein CNR22_03395 [Sphingobacteriaceae bacterium]|nr:hypothetical protein CNR22_03395 [Sphingobacteriaceae bacterium]
MDAFKNTFLFSWNPIKFSWPDIGEQSEFLRSGGKVEDSWTCASHKKIQPGDRAFVSVVGVEPRGIFASGHVSSLPFLGKNRKGTMTHRVLINFDVLLDPAKESILTLDILALGRLEKQVWTPQASGISIKKEFVEELELLWQDFLLSKKKKA